MSRIPAPVLTSILLTIYPKSAMYPRDEIIRQHRIESGKRQPRPAASLKSGTVLKVAKLKSRRRRRREVLKF